MTRLPKIVPSAVVVMIGALAGIILIAPIFAQERPPNLKKADAHYVGSQRCAECHQSETELWRASQHKRAMAPATDVTVLGNFDNASFDYHGARSRFFRMGKEFFVETDGPDGKFAPFRIKYTFGIYPLQQYLIEFPDGRIQALSIAWDSRPKEQGGQRWFHLYPKEHIQHDDVLHWTKVYQNWNHMCAECHSTDVHKNYDATSNRFDTKWSEISVGCEACHGPGSKHVDWAQAQKANEGNVKDPTMGLAVQFDERHDVSWPHDLKTGLPQRSKQPALLRKEVETCGRCHARRSEISEKWSPGQWLSATHEVSLLDRTTFTADGQMRDNEETYNYAAFKQSKMFAKGVTCSDCHDPHSATLRAPGSSVCLQCHTAGKYQVATHSHHDVNSSVTCISCHMPVRTYMVVDRRHDHSFRVPRPDLSVKLGAPNACNDCHRDKSAQWAADAVGKWFGSHREGFQHFAEAFHAAWTDQPSAEKLLAKLASDSATPAFVRASAFNELNTYVAQVDTKLVREGLSDPDPTVRVSTLDMLAGTPVDRLWPLLSPLLSDPIRGVRIKTASVLAAMPTASQPPADRERFKLAAAEFVESQQLNADRPEARTALGNFYAQRGHVKEAEAEFMGALNLSPQYAPAAVNMADLYREVGRDKDGVVVLQKALLASPRDAALHYALGLGLIRMKEASEALEQLRRAAELAPEQARYAYVYAVGLNSAGRTDDAISVLKQSLTRHPSDRDALLAIILFNRNLGNFASALHYAERLAQEFPADGDVARIISDLKNSINKRRKVTPAR